MIVNVFLAFINQSILSTCTLARLLVWYGETRILGEGELHIVRNTTQTGLVDTLLIIRGILSHTTATPPLRPGLLRWVTHTGMGITQVAENDREALIHSHTALCVVPKEADARTGTVTTTTTTASDLDWCTASPLPEMWIHTPLGDAAVFLSLFILGYLSSRISSNSRHVDNNLERRLLDRWIRLNIRIWHKLL